jgi:hypothetical protein
MKCAWILVVALLPASAAVAQNSIPPGTLLPISLDTGLSAARLHAGQTIHGRVMQDIPGTPVRRHNLVIGHVVEVQAAHSGQARLEISFDSVKTRDGVIPIRADLRAMASMMAVEDAKIPEEMADRATPPEVATTEQIGGEQVYRGGGPVTAGDQIVGKPLPYGVLGVPRPNAEGDCRGTVGGNNQPQALWLFSTDACGLYGFDGLQIQHRGRTEPAGQIVLTSTKRKLDVASGSGLLLRVEAGQDGRS